MLFRVNKTANFEGNFVYMLHAFIWTINSLMQILLLDFLQILIKKYAYIFNCVKLDERLDRYKI